MGHETSIAQTAAISTAPGVPQITHHPVSIPTDNSSEMAGTVPRQRLSTS
ncbi:hypothetical protein ACI2I2_16105 [Scandinavium sp. NPDC088450]